MALLQGSKPFYYDSGNYWQLGSTFVKGGHFSLLNFESPLRGYLLPLIDRGLHAVAQTLKWKDSSSAEVFNVLVFSLIGAMLAPRLAKLAWKERSWGIGRRLTLVLALIVFWSGYLNFPLSDFPALAMVLLALVSVSRSHSAGHALLTGLATGAAVDMRPSYLLLAPIVLVLAVWNGLEQRRTERSTNSREIICLGVLLVGFVVVSLPQSLAVHRHFHTWSFIPGSPAHLESLQLTEGLRIQLYDTYVGAGQPPQMFYEDDAGRRILFEQKNHTVTGVGQYLRAVVDHPITMGGVFARHVIDGLDVRYSTPYIEHLDSGSHRWRRMAGFLLIFLGLMRVLWPAARRSLGVARWRYPVAFLLCCLTAIPSAMEPRYLLPVYLLSYMLVLAPGWPSPIDTTAVGISRFGRLAMIVGTYVLFMIVIWHVASEATSHLHFG